MPEDRLTRDPRPVSSFRTVRRYDEAPPGDLTPPEPDDRDVPGWDDWGDPCAPYCIECGAPAETKHAPTCYFHIGNSTGGR